MTKRQFMEELRSSLEGMVSQAVIQENMNYYEDYINEQIRNGKNEQDVLNELGSPRLIARSIISSICFFSMIFPPFLNKVNVSISLCYGFILCSPKSDNIYPL
mgnify:FL=1